ncbi:hypothetical protein [Polynucleobacter rarus]|uniref:hypothetical protein n=1 Tax=Polynucleobacter rarus TaxID=556055 RepID=UPI00131EFC28
MLNISTLYALELGLRLALVFRYLTTTQADTAVVENKALAQIDTLEVAAYCHSIQ